MIPKDFKLKTFNFKLTKYLICLGIPTFDQASDLIRYMGYSNSLFIQWECIGTPTTTPTTSTTTYSLPYCATYTLPTGSCPLTNSPYEPTFLTNSTTTSFNYPIYETGVCQFGKIVLNCPINTVIHIYAGK